MSQFFNLGHGEKRVPSLDAPWPYDIDVCFEDIPEPISFSEGLGFGSYGSTVSIQNALDPGWREYFVITKTEWLLPFLERSTQGIPLPKEEILAQYLQIRGRSAESHELVNPSPRRFRRVVIYQLIFGLFFLVTMLPIAVIPPLLLDRKWPGLSSTQLGIAYFASIAIGAFLGFVVASRVTKQFRIGRSHAA